MFSVYLICFLFLFAVGKGVNNEPMKDTINTVTRSNHNEHNIPQNSVNTNNPLVNTDNIPPGQPRSVPNSDDPLVSTDNILPRRRRSARDSVPNPSNDPGIQPEASPYNLTHDEPSGHSQEAILQNVEESEKNVSELPQNTLKPNEETSDNISDDATSATTENPEFPTNKTIDNITTTDSEETTEPSTPSSETEEDTLTPTTPPGESEESIASISIFFILLLLGISVVMVHLFINFNFHYLPESISFVLLGFVVGAILFILNLFGYDYQYQETFSPQFFFLVLLPPIIFESGYSLHKGNFFQNLGSIMVFAIFGTAISAVIVGGGIYGLGVMGVIYEMTLIQSFTFGALISAVDPVATLAIFHALHVDPTLNMLVFGESVLNDAVSIVLTKTILNQLPSDDTNNSSDMTAAQILGNSAWQFCVMFFGSALLGIVSALVSALFLKFVNLRRHQSLEFTMWVIFAFGPYFLAEGLHLSGIMAILFCGIVMSHYTHHNLSPVTQVTVQQALRTVAFMAETGVFLYLGLAVFSINKSFDLALIIWSIVLILVGRAANIFPLTGLLNVFRSVKISIRMQCIMCYSGLRGAVAFALAENLREYFHPDVTGYIVTTTLVIVLFTIVILGGSTLPLLKFLKADKGTKLTLSKTEEQGITLNTNTIERGFSRLNLHNLRNCTQWFMYLDYRYIRPWFIRRFTREEVKAARFEMQQKTVEWYQGLREASLSDEDLHDTDGSTASTSLSSPL